MGANKRLIRILIAFSEVTFNATLFTGICEVFRGISFVWHSTAISNKHAVCRWWAAGSSRLESRQENTEGMPMVVLKEGDNFSNIRQ